MIIIVTDEPVRRTACERSAITTMATDKSTSHNSTSFEQDSMMPITDLDDAVASRVRIDTESEPSLEQQLDAFINSQQARDYLSQIKSMVGSDESNRKNSTTATIAENEQLYERLLAILKSVKIDRLLDDGQALVRLLETFPLQIDRRDSLIRQFIEIFLEPQDVD